jgi:bifunctional non-homologous end joining protein LigD
MTAIAGVEISHPDKALFPDGTTKADLARYYARIAEMMLPHVRGRPVHMQRYPDGIDGVEIQQKQAPDYFPDFVARARVERKRGGFVEHVVIDNVETLVYLADQACITPHTWLSRTGALDDPDQLVFDLDPPDGALAALRDGARTLRDILHDIGLRAYLKATGSRGFHVVTPLDHSAGFDDARALARSIAQRVIDRDAERFTIEQRKDRRGDRIYIDIARNGYAQTVVAPYAVRALAGAPVAAPLDWQELDRAKPQQVTVHNIFRRLARRPNLWRDFNEHAGSVAEARAKLAELPER